MVRRLLPRPTQLLAPRLKVSRRRACSRIPPRACAAPSSPSSSHPPPPARNRARRWDCERKTLRELFLEVTGADARSLPSPELDVRYTIANTGTSRWPSWLDRTRRRRSWTSRRTPLRCGGACRVACARPGFARFSTAVEGRLTMHWAGHRPSHRSLALVQRRLQLPARRLSAQPAPSPLRRRRRPGLRARRGLAFAVGDLVLRNQVTLAEAPGWGVAARLDLKLPVGSLGRAADPAGSMPAPACSGRWSRRAADLARAPRAERVLGAGLHLFAAAEDLALHRRAVHRGVLGRDHLPGRGPRAPRRSSRPAGPAWPRTATTACSPRAPSRTSACTNQVSFALRRGRLPSGSARTSPRANPHSSLKWAWSSNAPTWCSGSPSRSRCSRSRYASSSMGRTSTGQMSVSALRPTSPSPTTTICAPSRAGESCPAASRACAAVTRRPGCGSGELLEPQPVQDGVRHLLRQRLVASPGPAERGRPGTIAPSPARLGRPVRA